MYTLGELTIGGGVRWVATKVLGRTRCRVEAWWALRTAEMRWHALGLLRLLWRRREARTALGSTASHYAAEQITRTVADLGWLRSRRAAVLGVLAGAAAGFQVALEMRNPLLVPEVWSAIRRHMRWRVWGERDLLCFHLVVLLLEVVDLAADHLDLLDMAGD